ALRLKRNEALASITAIKDNADVFHTAPGDVNRIFKEFYEHLYRSEVGVNEQPVIDFLLNLDLPQLSEQQCAFLDSPIELKELKEALEVMNKVISLLLKKGKEPLYCSSYRPISLIGMDVKLYAKVLAHRLGSVTSFLIAHDQTGFLKERFATDNIWLQVDSQIAWRDVEASAVLPHRLQDILFTGLSKKDLRFGNTIVYNSLKIWHEVCKFMGSSSKFTSESTIWHNHNLQSDNRPFVFKPWSDQGVHTLGDIFNNQGLRSFQDLKECYNLPGHSYFLYLRLRSAMRAYGVPWNCNLDSHPLMDCFTELFTDTRSSVIYLQQTAQAQLRKAPHHHDMGKGIGSLQTKLGLDMGHYSNNVKKSCPSVNTL
ncbi:hypothetical protein PO909_023562, partial [Leuciscus waleckii]